MVVTRRMRLHQSGNTDNNANKDKTDKGVSKKNDKNASSVSNGKSKKVAKNTAKEASNSSSTNTTRTCRTSHIVPLPLVAIILLCSGPLWVLSFRDVFATGRGLFATDTSLLKFTKSTQWYDDSKGWKSTMGGMSSVQRVTTDVNDMGGLYIRKVCGVAGMAYHMHKLLPILVPIRKADWRMGHYNLLLSTGVFGNVCLVVFYLMYLDDISSSGAGKMCLTTVVFLGMEAVVMFLYVLSNVLSPRFVITDAKSLPEGKSPNSLVSNILARTISMVSGMIAIVAARDLFYPGTVLAFPPRDDIYLEWIGALMHSPPAGSHEQQVYGFTSPLRIGDKFCGRLMGLYLLLGCVQKFVGVFGVRVGKDGMSGEISTRMFWIVQALGDGLLVFVWRLFASAAKSASWNLKWHLMALGYETFMLALNAFF